MILIRGNLATVSKVMFSGNDSPEPETSVVGSYYDSASGKSGSSLKSALHEIIDDHTEISYSNVWDALK
ncbi:hypothetical protein [Peribacillus simplex]|uniref:hypothetical protein n=1 Tax=Peribacillus simplex TaxID=1478 RepID=UPI003D26C3E5